MSHTSIQPSQIPSPANSTRCSSSSHPLRSPVRSALAMPEFMPLRGHRTAPTFDPTDVRSLRRYFQDLETLFVRCQVTRDADKKKWAVRYTSLDVSELWEILDSFDNASISFDDFEKDVQSLYPGSESSHWSLADLEQLVGERARIGVHNLADLASYYREFLVVSKSLVTKGRLSSIEQSRIFVKGFQSAFLARIRSRLEIKHPDHLPDEPYTFDAIFDAAKFLLHGTSIKPSVSITAPTASNHSTVLALPSTPSANTLTVSTLPLIPSMTASTIASMAQDPSKTSTTLPVPSTASIYTTSIEPVQPKQFCHYCGKENCWISICSQVTTDIAAGLCKRNNDGKIVLPTGSFVPRSTPGFTIRDHTLEWHRQHSSTQTPAQRLYDNSSNYKLDTAARIDALERELHQLRKVQQAPHRVELLQRKSTMPTTSITPSPMASTARVPTPSPSIFRFDSSTSPATVPTTSRTTTTTTTRASILPSISSPYLVRSSPTSYTVHSPSSYASNSQPPPLPSFVQSTKVPYAPPAVRNFALKPSYEKGTGSTYKTVTPVYQPRLAEEVFVRLMNSPVVSISREELLSISPALREKHSDAALKSSIEDNITSN